MRLGAATREHASQLEDLVAQARGVLNHAVAIVERRDEEKDAVVRLAGVERARLTAALDGLAQVAALSLGRSAKQAQAPPDDV